MYHKRFFAGLSLALMIMAALFMWGCSDDEPSAPTNTTQPGDPEDPVFVVVQDQINNCIDSMALYFDYGLDNIYSVPMDSDQVEQQHGSLGPDDTLITGYSGGWHTLYVSIQHEQSFDKFINDSVQFQIDGVPVESPDGLDYLHFIRRWGVEWNVTDVSYTNGYGRFEFEYSNLDQDVTTLNGSNDVLLEWRWYGDQATVEATFDVHVTIDEVQISKVPNYGWTSGCPSSGMMTMDIDEAYWYDDGTNSDMTLYSWEAAVVFEDGTATISVYRDNTVWTWTRELCTPYWNQ